MAVEENELPRDRGKHIGVDQKALWFEALLQSIPEGILIAGAGEVNVLVISRYGQEILALPGEQILHHPFRRLLERVDFFRPDGTTPIAYGDHPLIRALEHGDSADDDELVLRNAAHETYTVSSKYGPIRSEGGEIVAGIFSWMDISERKKIEQELAGANRRLESANQTLESFSYSAAHDLREPLRKIIGFGNIIEKEYRDVLSGDALELFNRMRAAAQRMQSMIDSLLEFSRLSARPVELAPVDLNQIVGNVVAELEGAIRGAGASVQVLALPTIPSDPELMEHVFQNLIENALKFRRTDAVPHVRVSQEPPPAGMDDWVRIVVADNGIGFEMEHLDRIFLPFQRLHGRSQYPGSGLGLSIVKKIIEQHGGQISASSQPGGGSTFYLDLPRKANEHQAG